MQDQSEYKDTIIDTIIETLQNNLPENYFKQFFYGDPLYIPDSLLPCVIVEKTSSTIAVENTAMDHLISSVRIKLAYNKKNDFGKSSAEVVGVRALEQYAEGIDPETGEYDEQSVVGILRKNFTMGNTRVDQSVNIEYGVVPRPEETMTAEAWIDCTFKELLIVSGRS